MGMDAGGAPIAAQGSSDRRPHAVPEAYAKAYAG
jgi:hypothetical protein